jgi:ATP-binding protein involved in chromosome partitioning
MLGISPAKPESRDGKSMEPLEAYGVQAMSIGFMIDPRRRWSGAARW